ncbi:unnamed protein product, partial [Brenthis ino]
MECRIFPSRAARIIFASLHAPNIIMHSLNTYGRAFGSPYLYPKSGNAELFPQLTDEDLGLIRCPALLDDGLLEKRYKNCMIEFLHTSTFSQNVLAVQLKKHYYDAMRTGVPNVDVLISSS